MGNNEVESKLSSTNGSKLSDAAGSSSTSSTSQALCVRDFSFAYAGEAHEVLSHLNFDIPRGAFALLVGKTGSGKSTLLSHIKPELAPLGKKGGKIYGFDQDIDTLSTSESAHLIAYVAQNPMVQLVCFDVISELAFALENTGMPDALLRRRVAEVAQFFALEPFLHKETSKLSGGQAQLLNLASALALQPKLLLLDEPTAQLDPITEKRFVHELFRVNRELGVSVVVATHAPERMAHYATCAFELEGGQIFPRNLENFKKQAEEVCASKMEAAGEGEMANGREVADKCGACAAHLDKTPGKASKATKSSAPTISLTDVYFRYNQDDPWVLRSCDFCVSSGNINMIVGGNGSGKSTLLRMIACALKSKRGSVKNAYVGKQALLPQDPRKLFVCDSVHDELMEWAHTCSYTKEDVQRIAKKFSLSECFSRHPFDLSGGQQQILALAKLLLTRPKLLLLDEPTAGLDAKAKENFVRVLKTCAENDMTIICATHDLAFAQALASEISLLFDGQIIHTSTPQEFFENNLFYQVESLRSATIQKEGVSFSQEENTLRTRSEKGYAL